MLTGFLALLVAVYSSARFQAFWSVVRPFILYAIVVVAIGIAVVGAYQLAAHHGALEEQAKMEREVRVKIEADNKRLQADKQALNDDLGMIQAENDGLKAKIERLPTSKEIIAHPRAAAKVFNDTMSGQFKRFEDITK